MNDNELQLLRDFRSHTPAPDAETTRLIYALATRASERGGRRAVGKKRRQRTLALRVALVGAAAVAVATLLTLGLPGARPDGRERLRRGPERGGHGDRRIGAGVRHGRRAHHPPRRALGRLHGPLARRRRQRLRDSSLRGFKTPGSELPRRGRGGPSTAATRATGVGRARQPRGHRSRQRHDTRRGPRGDPRGRLRRHPAPDHRRHVRASPPVRARAAPPSTAAPWRPG